MKAKVTAWLPVLIAAFCGTVIAIPRAHGQLGIPRYPAYRYATYVPGPEYTANRVPYVIRSNPEFYYYYDPVNRPYALTPEPVWRAMFPGIHARIDAEVREFGAPGASLDELAYWQWLYRQTHEDQAAAEKPAPQAKK